MIWSKVFFVSPIGDKIDPKNPESYTVMNMDMKDTALLHQIIAQVDRSKMTDYYLPVNGHITRCIPKIQQLDNFTVILYADMQGMLIVHKSIQSSDFHWIASVVSELYPSRILTKDILLNTRYQHLSHITEYIDEPSDQSEFLTTIPRVNFNSIMNTKRYEGTEPILKIIISEDIQDIHDLIFEIGKYVAYLHVDEHEHNLKIIEKILKLSNDYHHKVIDDKREVVIHKLQLFYVLTRVYIPRQIFNDLIEYGKGIIKMANDLQMSNIVWVLNTLLSWFFGVGEPVKRKKWGSLDIPNNLNLLPSLLEIKDNVQDKDPLDVLKLYLELNESMELQILVDGYEELQEKIANTYLRLDDYNSAEMFFNYALTIYEYQKRIDRIIKIQQKIINAIQKHYEEVAITANFFSNNGRTADAVTLAWGGLLIALRLVKLIYDFSMNAEGSLRIILKYFDMCRRPLIKVEDDMTEVVMLKLDELNQFFNSLFNKELDDETAKMYIEMHSESLKFMVPQKPPLFMFMTSDGRLLYTREATADSDADTDTSYLVAGALTAIRSVLTEASMSQSGSVKEITLGDSVLLIEARKSVVVVVSVLKLDDNLRKFTQNVADVIEENWGPVIYDWFGDRESIEPVIEYIDSSILEELIDN
ncbi:MAG: hypothetical protein INQ03_01110 [Candidatus Heimdallarchaeota archaeon]|nr:hypothetical protein [Candidatus Heimdallarchaeota archaeon]